MDYQKTLLLYDRDLHSSKVQTRVEDVDLTDFQLQEQLLNNYDIVMFVDSRGQLKILYSKAGFKGLLMQSELKSPEVPY
jgi:hypothetical protein